jgi:hypothetical protein
MRKRKRTSSLAGVKLEYLYTGLLAASFVGVTWFAAYVVYRLFQGQR